MTTFALYLTIGSSCPVLRNFAIYGPQDTQRAEGDCTGVYNEQIVWKMARLSRSQDQGSQNPKDTIYRIKTNNLLPGGMRPHPSEPTASEGKSRPGRSLANFITGFLFSNVLETIVSALLPNQNLEMVKDKINGMEIELANLNQNTNVTSLQTRALAEAHVLTSKLVENNIEKIKFIASQYPDLTIVGSHIISKMHIFGSYLDRIRVSQRSRRLDLDTLQLLFNTDVLANVDPASIINSSVDIQLARHNTLYVTFAARTKSEDTSVYNIKPVKYWTNLTESVASRMEYTGHRFVVYNRTANCMKAINDPTTDHVAVICDQHDWFDPSLSEWKIVSTSHDPLGLQEKTQVIEGWPNILVYCWPSYINVQGTREQCPPYPFVLNASVAWTTESFAWRPSNIELAALEGADPLVHNVHLGHFANQSFAISENHLIKQIKAKEDKIEELMAEHIFAQIGEHKVNYKHTTYGFGSFATLIVVAAGIYLMKKVHERYRILISMDAERRRAAHFDLPPRRRPRAGSYDYSSPRSASLLPPISRERQLEILASHHSSRNPNLAMVTYSSPTTRS